MREGEMEGEEVCAGEGEKTEGGRLASEGRSRRIISRGKVRSIASFQIVSDLSKTQEQISFKIPVNNTTIQTCPYTFHNGTIRLASVKAHGLNRIHTTFGVLIYILSQ